MCYFAGGGAVICYFAAPPPPSATGPLPGALLGAPRGGFRVPAGGRWRYNRRCSVKYGTPAVERRGIIGIAPDPRERPESNPRGRSGFVLVYQNVCATVFAALDVILSTIRVTLTLQRPNFGLLPKREAGIEPARSIPVCPNACVTVLPP